MALRAPVPAAAAAGDDTCTNQIHTQQVNSTETQQSHARMEYVMQMRRMFSPPGAVCPDGSINQVGLQPPAPGELPTHNATPTYQHLHTAVSICLADEPNL
jgi:hypothetical protein